MLYLYTRQHIIGVAAEHVANVWSADGTKDAESRLVGQRVLGVIRGLDFDTPLPLDQIEPATNDRLKLAHEGSTSSITSDIILRVQNVDDASVPPPVFQPSQAPVSIRPQPKYTPAPITQPEPASVRSQTLKHALRKA